MVLCFGSFADVLVGNKKNKDVTKDEIGRSLLGFIYPKYAREISESYLLRFMNQQRDLIGDLKKIALEPNKLSMQFSQLLEQYISLNHDKLLKNIVELIQRDVLQPDHAKNNLLQMVAAMKLSSFLAELFIFILQNTNNDQNSAERRGIPPDVSIEQTDLSFLPESVQRKDNTILNGLVLPWLPTESPQFNLIFKDLFIPPETRSNNRRVRLSFDDLLRHLATQSTVAVIGDAGCGKSTLLKYLYLYETKTDNRFYFTASEIIAGKAPLFYKITQLSGDDASISLYVDGLDEAYVSHREESERLASMLLEYSGLCCIMAGMRNDFLFKHFSDPNYGFFSDTISMEPWTRQMADRYTEEYAKKTKNGDLAKRYHQLIRNNPVMEQFTNNPFQLTMLLFLLETKYSTDMPAAGSMSNYSVYSLYEDFYKHWLKRERFRKTGYGQRAFAKHYAIARKLYDGEPVLLEDENDTAVTGLLIYEETPNGKEVSRFYHQSLAAFILAKKAVERFLIGGAELVDTLLELMKNDVTDFVKEATYSLSRKKLARIQANLQDLYSLIYAPDGSEASRRLKKLSDRDMLLLKDQLVFFVSRLPHISTEDFLRTVSRHETHPNLRLDLAYATAIKGPILEIALEYAKRITPGSPEDMTNRSWTLIYYDDVDEEAYTYIDDGSAPWTNARSARIRRLQKDSGNAVRFRMFDLPLLYTFFVSRNWNDLSEEELRVFEGCKTSYPELPDEVNRFLEQAKKKLCEEYAARLRGERGDV